MRSWSLQVTYCIQMSRQANKRYLSYRLIPKEVSLVLLRNFSVNSAVNPIMEKLQHTLIEKLRSLSKFSH